MLDLVWPPPAGCDLCARKGDSPVCPLCRAACLEQASVARCLLCTRPVRGVELCGDCRLGQPFARVVSVGIHQGALRSAIHRLKYRGRTRLAAPLAELLAPLLDAREGDLLVPVPLYRSRQRERGYNQAALLAGALGRALSLPVTDRWLVRCRRTEAQARLSRAERLRNMEGAFALGRRGTPPWTGRRVWVVDDVLTTGATASAVAALLLATGATEVSVATIAVSASAAGS